ncbi:hypothetical protein HS1_001371 [Candidatus Desulfofervidus auxilii]|uniref:Uncharacterized protein n=1 Tax=Desulfofervidus auxilii TaxID=1621989 RepID=A0A7U4TGW2_DESA2|nr:hypothetical protein HS1_001371 [Candidatus Desulfofervidus auxilii]
MTPGGRFEQRGEMFHYLDQLYEVQGQFKIAKIEDIIRYSTERYFDTITQRVIVVERHDDRLVLIPYEEKGNEVTPITIHTTTRQQINFRLKAGRFRHG